MLAGTRDDIRDADDDAQLLFTKLLFDIDRHDLYGKIAIPKQHSIDQVPDIYRYATRSRGVLVNPSLNENFALTLIDATAMGWPVIATSQGGPQEMIANCRHDDPSGALSITRGLKLQPASPQSVYKWGFQRNDFLVSEDAGNDIDILASDTLGVVIGGYSEELSH